MKRFLTCAAVFLLAFFSFTYSVRFHQTTDSLPNNYTALNLLFYKRLDLTNMKEGIVKKGIVNIGVTNSRGVYFSKTPILMGILSAPSFSLVNAYYGVSFMSVDQILKSEYNQYIGKISASFYTALSAVFLLLFLLKAGGRWFSSIISVLVYVFGTNVFNTVSQANWQHAISLFLITLTLLLIISRYKRFGVIFLSGMILGLASQVRISNGFYLLFPVLFLRFFYPWRQYLARLVVLFGGFILIYAVIAVFYLKLQVPYGYQGAFLLSFQSFSPLNVIGNVISVLFSFNHGLFVFSPVLLLSLVIFFRVPSDSKNSIERYIFSSLVPVLTAFIIFTGFWHYWAGGYSLNARLLSESLPVWMFLLALAVGRFWQSLVFRGLFVVLFLMSIGINFLTTYMMDGLWFPLYTKGTAESQIRDAWFNRPALIPYIIKSRLIKIEQLEKRDNKIMIHLLVFRFNFDQKQLVKFEDTNSVILDLSKK